MFRTYQDMIDQSTPGRFEGEGAMTAYIYDLMANGDNGDDQVDFGDCDGVTRYGRRLLCISSTGFVSLVVCHNPNGVNMAEQAMEELHQEWDRDEDEDGKYTSEDQATCPACGAHRYLNHSCGAK
jgi:hypothetical protein